MCVCVGGGRSGGCVCVCGGVSWRPDGLEGCMHGFCYFVDFALGRRSQSHSQSKPSKPEEHPESLPPRIRLWDVSQYSIHYPCPMTFCTFYHPSIYQIKKFHLYQRVKSHDVATSLEGLGTSLVFSCRVPLYLLHLFFFFLRKRT